MIVAETVVITAWALDAITGLDCLAILGVMEVLSWMYRCAADRPLPNWCALCNAFGHLHGTCGRK